jgi:S1-C subfamily serine protease
VVKLIYFCHAPNDRVIAEKVYFELKHKGLSCWIPTQDIRVGQYYAEATVNAIEKSDIVVLIYSANSNTSTQTIHELQKATSQNKFIIPFSIDTVKPSKFTEFYMSSPYKVDATTGFIQDNINKLENVVKQTYQQLYGNNANNINTVNDTFPNINPLENDANTRISFSNNQSQETIGSNEIIKEDNFQPQANQNLPLNNQMNPNFNNQSNIGLNNQINPNNNNQANTGFNNQVNPNNNNQANTGFNNQINPNNNNQANTGFNNQINPNYNNINHPINQNIPPTPQPKSTNKTKSIFIIGGSILGGIVLLSILFILGRNLLFSPTNKNIPSGNNIVGKSNVSIEGSKYTEEDIIEFAKNSILELDRLQSTSEFYDEYGYNGPEYDLDRIQEDVFFAIMDLDVVRFNDVSIVGKSEKTHGIEYLLNVNFVCYADYETTENNKPVHHQGEALLYNNVVILETLNDGLRYLYMEGIFEDELNARNEDIESSYQEIAKSGDVDTEDTIQTYLPDSTDEDAIMSVKDIVNKNDHKVVAVYVDVPEGQSQGSGFFIKDGVIVTNYHVIEGGESAKILLSNGNYVDVEGVLYTDSNIDIAILKLAKEVGIKPVTIGQILDTDKGSIAVAIGSPLGLFNTVSTGIISNFWEADGVNLIQISIPITNGNSGGALFNESGKLIGITSSGIGEANLNFAISSTHIIPIYEDINSLSYNQLMAVPLSSADENTNSITRQTGSSNNTQTNSSNNNQANSTNQDLLSSKYKFVNSDMPISNESTYTSDFQTIFNLSINEYYTEEYLYNDLSYGFDYILDYGTENYVEFLEYILHDTYIKEDIENYKKINDAVLEVHNTTDQYIEFTVDDIEIIGAGIKKDGTIDGIIVRALFYENSEPYVRSKFYFRANYDSWGDVDRFLYVGEVSEK